MVGYVIGYLSFFTSIRSHRALRRNNPDVHRPEVTLYWLLSVSLSRDEKRDSMIANTLL